MADQTFHVKLERDDDVWTVTCGGELDGTSAWHLSDAIELCLNNKPASVLMDCSDVTFIDSGGLWALLRAAREAHARSVAYRVTLSEQVLEVVHKAGILERLLTGPGAMAPTLG
jgi:anti-anti-sigma factor